MSITDEEVDLNEYYFNHYKHNEPENTVFDFRRIDSEFLNIVENTIVGLAFALICFLLFSTILSSNYVYVFFKTCVHRPQQNLQILWNIVNLRNPVYKLVSDALREDGYERISKRKYRHYLEKFARKERSISNDNRKSYHMHKSVFKLQHSFSKFTGAQLVNVKELKEEERLRMVVKSSQRGKAFEATITASD